MTAAAAVMGGALVTTDVAGAASCGGYAVPDNGFTCAQIPAASTPNGDYGPTGLNKGNIYFTSTTEGYGKNFVLDNTDISASNLFYTNVGILLGTRAYDSASVRRNTLTGHNLTVEANGRNAGTNAISGIGAGYGSETYFDNVSLTFTEANNGDINGILAGQAYNDKAPASANLTNLVKISGDYTFKAVKTDLANPNPVTGIRAIQNNDGRIFLANPPATGAVPRSVVTIGGTYTADITAAYGNGVYVSGKDTAARPMPQVNLGDTNITLHGGGNALHVGRSDRGLSAFQRDGWGAGTLVFADGAAVNIDQSDATGEAIVLVYGNSVLDASKTASFKVRSKGSALRVGSDFLTTGTQASTAPITGSFNNADWTLSDSASAESLLRVGGNQADASLLFTGRDTNLLATNAGYLMDVEACRQIGSWPFGVPA